MITVSVLYPKTSTSHFDFDYYLQTHTPLVQSRFAALGMERIRLMRGTGSLDGSAPAFEVIAELSFTSAAHLQDAVAQHGGEILSDIPKFTDVQPLIQINEELEAK